MGGGGGGGDPDDYVRETITNYDPTLHPFEVPREYTRHISCITKHNKSMSTIICGACDGEVEDDKSIKQWNIEAPVHGVREEPINMILGKVHHALLLTYTCIYTFTHTHTHTHTHTRITIYISFFFSFLLLQVHKHRDFLFF
uniref:Ddb1 and cul4 associated factor 13 n=1 Tax=Cyprinus carpio TaxID=7962 RepID=A0A8C2BY00_CYPCA